VSSPDGFVATVRGSPEGMIDVRDAPDRDRYELLLDGEVVGVLDYRRDGDGALLLTHAEVSPHVGGRGFGTALVRGALDDLAAKDESIVPLCSFVRAFVRDNPAYRSLLAQRV
jgi:hypothetical protein